MSLWGKIKSWFTGGNKSVAKSNTYQKQSRIPQPRANTTISSQYGYRGYKPQEEEKPKEPERKVYTDSKEYKYKRIEDSKKIAENVKKNSANPDPIKLKKIQEASKKREKESKAYNKIIGDDGSKSRAQLKLEQKMRLQDREAKDAEFSSKYHKHSYAASRGVLKGVTLGASETAMKHSKNEELKKIDEEYTKNQTKLDKVIEGASELAGNMATYGATSGISKAGAGKLAKGIDRFTKADNLSKGLATSTGEKIEQKFIQRYGKKAGKKMYDALKTDAAINVTTGLAQSTIDAANTEGSAMDKARTFAGDTALNMVVGGGLTLGLTRFSERGAIRAFRNLKAGEAKGSAGKNIPKLTNTKYDKKYALVGKDIVQGRKPEFQMETGKVKRLENVAKTKPNKEMASYRAAMDRLAEQRKQGLVDEETFLKEREAIEKTYSRIKNGETFNQAKEGRMNLVDSDQKHGIEVGRLAKKEGYSRMQAEAEIERARRGQIEIARNGDIGKQRNAILKELDAQLERGEITPYEYNEKMNALKVWNDESVYNQADARVQKFDERTGASAENREIRETVKDARARADELKDKAAEAEREMYALREQAGKAKRKSDRQELRRQYQNASRKMNEYRAEANRVLKEADEWTGNLQQANRERIFGEEIQAPKTDAPTVENPRAVQQTKEGDQLIQDVTAELKNEGQFAGTDDAIPFGDNRTQADRTLDDANALVNNKQRYQPKKATVQGSIREKINREMPDGVEEARKVVKDYKPRTESERQVMGEYQQKADDFFNDYVKAVNEGDEVKMAEAKERFARMQELTEHMDDTLEHKVYNKNESIDFEGINDLTETTKAKGTTVEDAEAFHRKRVIRNQALAPDERISDTAETAYKAATSDLGRKIVKNLQNSLHKYDVQHNVENINKAVDYVFETSTPKDCADRMLHMIRTGEMPNIKEYLQWKYRAEVLREYAAMNLEHPDPEIAKSFANLYTVSNQYITTRSIVEGQSIQAMGAYARLSPKMRAFTTKEQLASLFREKGITKDFEKILAENPDLKKFIDEIGNAETVEEAVQAELKARKYTQSVVGRTWVDLWNQYRYTSMLTSIPTHARNVMGNVFNTLKSIGDDSIAGALQAGMKDAVDSEGNKLIAKKTKSVNPIGAVMKAYGNKEGVVYKTMKENFDADRMAMMSGGKYIDVKADSQMVYKKGKLVAKSKGMRLFDKISGFNSSMLDYEDEVFMKTNYYKQFAEVCEANKLGLGKAKGQVMTDEEILKLARDTAREEAVHMTFRDYSEMAEQINNFVRKADDPSQSWFMRLGARSVGIAQPFVKTPINIMKQSAVDNTMVGLMKGLRDFHVAKNNLDMVGMDKALSEIAKGSSGTAIMFVGAMLGARDMTDNLSVTTNLSNSERDKNFKQHGWQNYSIKAGDKSVPLGWCTPLAASFFMGAEVGKMFTEKMRNADGGTANQFDTAAGMSHVVSRLVEPLLETTMLQGLNTTLESTTSDDEQNVFINLMHGIKNNAIDQMKPAMLRQIVNTIAPYDYLMVNYAETDGGRDREYRWNQTKANMGLALAADTVLKDTALGDKLHMAPGVDVRGNVKTKGSLPERVWKNMLSPVKTSKIQWDETDDETLRVYDELAKDPSLAEDAKKVFEKTNYKTAIKVGSNKYDLTVDEVSERNQAKLKAGGKAVESALESRVFNQTKWRMSDEEKQRIINKTKNMTLHEAVGFIQTTPQWKGSSAAEQKSILEHMYGSDADHLDKGWTSYANRELYQSRGMSGANYDFDNELTEKMQGKLRGVADRIGYEQLMDVVHASEKVSYSDAEGENNGQRYVSHTRETIINALNDYGITNEEDRAEIYNALKSARSKDYYPGMTAKYSRGGRGYRHYGHGGSRKGKASKSSASQIYKGSTSTSSYKKAPTIKSSTKKTSSGTNSVVTDAYIQKILNQAKK